jgi:hypothetical protein
MRVSGTDRLALATLLNRFGLELRFTAPDEIIPGSYWGDSEAGLLGQRLYARYDTPLHSVLHEACHYVCMTPERRVGLTRDAGGDDAEEAAVCYLQVLLADEIPAFGRERLLADMDAWGYSYRLGSARRWFEEDAVDARAWLQQQRVIDAQQAVTGDLRC